MQNPGYGPVICHPSFVSAACKKSKEATSKLPFASISKRVLVRNHLNENEFDLQENGRAGETHFHTNGFARDSF